MDIDSQHHACTHTHSDTHMSISIKDIRYQNEQV